MSTHQQVQPRMTQFVGHQLDTAAGALAVARPMTRRTLLGKALGLGAAALTVTAVGAVRTAAAQDFSAEQHTSEPYTVTANLNLRSGPGIQYAVILVIPKGATITLNQRYENGFHSVNYQGTIGWAHGDYIVKGGGSQPGSPVIIGTAVTTVALNLRSGPSTRHQVLRVLAKGASVQITGTVQNGFRYVVHQGLAGWAYDAYLISNAPGDGPYDPNSATTTAALNLRAEPSTSAKVLLVMPSGARVRLLDGYANGFRKVSYQGTVGWAHTAYLN